MDPVSFSLSLNASETARLLKGSKEPEGASMRLIALSKSKRAPSASNRAVKAVIKGSTNGVSLRSARSHLASAFSQVSIAECNNSGDPVKEYRAKYTVE